MDSTDVTTCDIGLTKLDQNDGFSLSVDFHFEQDSNPWAGRGGQVGMPSLKCQPDWQGRY